MPRRPPVTQRRNGPYAPLSAHYPRDDAILALDIAEDDLAELLFCRSLAYCAADPRLDGFISDAVLAAGVVLRRKNQARVVKKAERLAELGIYIREGAGYRMRSWAKWNRTHAEIEGKREADRTRKSGSHDEEPPPPEDRDGPDDSEGSRSDSTRNPDGTEAESQGVASRGYAGASNATHDNAPHVIPPQSSSSSTVSPPPLVELQTAMGRAGIRVSWDANDGQLTTIGAAIDRCGISALVKQATSQYQPSNPAFSVRAFVPSWGSLPANPKPLELVPDPCGHGFEHRSKCPTCRLNQAAAS